MTRDELITLLESHGSKPENWPDAARSATRNLLDTDPEAARILARFEEMDTALAAIPAPAFPGLATRIAGQALPEKQAGWPEALLNWLLPNGDLSMLWRPALLACLPLFVGVIVGSYYNFGIGSQSQSLEYWEDELAMISLTDYSQNQLSL